MHRLNNFGITALISFQQRQIQNRNLMEINAHGSILPDPVT